MSKTQAADRVRVKDEAAFEEFLSANFGCEEARLRRELVHRELVQAADSRKAEKNRRKLAALLEEAVLLPGDPAPA